MSDDQRTPAEIVGPLLRVRQIREFLPEVPTDEQLDAIADAARWSGSSTNSQPWRFIVIRDRDVLRQVHDAGLPQTRSLATAPSAIAIVVPDGDHAISYAYDEGRAAERMLIALSERSSSSAIPRSERSSRRTRRARRASHATKWSSRSAGRRSSRRAPRPPRRAPVAVHWSRRLAIRLNREASSLLPRRSVPGSMVRSPNARPCGRATREEEREPWESLRG